MSDSELTRLYLAADAQVQAMLKRGEIKAYSAKYERGQGRTIHVETDQGWNPAPFYRDADHTQ